MDKVLAAKERVKDDEKEEPSTNEQVYDPKVGYTN